MLKDTLRWVAIVGIIAIPVVLPFIVASTMFFPYITGKNFTFRIIVEVVAVAWVILAFLDARFRPRFSWILSAFVFFVAVVGLADLFGANPFKSFWSNFERMEGYITLLHLLAYFVVASTVLNAEKLWNVFWYASFGASMFVAGMGLGPILELVPDLSRIPRIDANFGNPIYLAVYSLFHIFIALVLLLHTKAAEWMRWVAGVGFAAFLGSVGSTLMASDEGASIGMFLLVTVVALLVLAALDIRWKARWLPYVLVLSAVAHLTVMVLTQTRGTVLGFIGGAMVTTVLIALLERSRPVLRGLAVGALVLAVVAVGTLYTIRTTDYAKENPLLARYTQISLTEGTVEARFMNWGMAWEGVKERPVLGWGQGNYEYVFSKYHDPHMYGEEPWFDRTHNIIFDWLVAAGFAGLIAYLLIPFSLLMHLWVIDPRERRWSLRSLASFSAIKALVQKRDDTFSATERALWTGLLAAYMFHNLFVFDNIVSYILFISVLAYLHWRVTQGHEPLWENVDVARETVMTVVLPITLIVGGAVMWFANVPGIMTSKNLIEALIPQYQLPNGQVVQRTPEDMLAIYEEALERDQLGRQEVREQFAQRAATMVRTEGVAPETKEAFRTRSIEAMQEELERNPESARLWLFMGSLYSNAGMIVDAEQAFATAVEKTPKKQAALFQYGEIKLMQGKIDESVEQFKKAYELVPEYDEARRLYALVLIRSGNDKQAVDLLTERFGTAAVDDSRLFMEWTNAKRYDIAAEILEKRVAENPGDVQQQVSLAATYKELGRTDEAVAILETVIEQYPEYADQIGDFLKEVRGW